MELVIPQKHVPTFHRVIQCLAKIGEDIRFQIPNDRTLVIKAINTSKSVMADLSYHVGFFSVFRVNPESVSNFKIQSKSCLQVFRSINSVESCRITYDSLNSTLVFELSCSLNTKKVYKLATQDDGPLRATYAKDTPNKLTFRPRIMLEVLQNFQSNLEEVTFVAGRDGVRIRSYLDEHAIINTSDALRTEVSVEIKDFEGYLLQTFDMEMTFPMKETKAILQLCENIGMPMMMILESPGRPIVFRMKFYTHFDVDFVVATAIPTSTQSSTSATPSNNTSQTSTGSNTSTPARRRSPPASPVSQTPPSSAASPRNASEDYRSGIGIGGSAGAGGGGGSGSFNAQEDPAAVPMDDGGHVSGSDDEEGEEASPIPVLPNAAKRTRRPMFSTDYGDDGDQ